MVAKNALLFTVLLASSMLFAGQGDWIGQLSINSTPAADGTLICAYVNGVENSRTTVGAYTSGVYLMTVVGNTGDNVTFKVFCEYAVNEGAQPWIASPGPNTTRNNLNLSVNDSHGPVLTRTAPATTGVATGTVTMSVSTNESATCRYSTSSGVAYANMSAATTTTLAMAHSWSVSAPTASTAYTYYLRCIDQFNHSSDQFTLSFTTAGSGGGGGGGGSSSGGGSVGGGSSSASTKSTNTSTVDIGAGTSCQVTITREMTSGQNLSVLTTTLDNVGGSACDLENFTFSDTIPDSFPAINEITFNPAYTSREGWQVTFNFPTFAGGESKTITYSVNSWVGSSKAKNFTVYEMTANKKSAAASTTQPTTNTSTSTTEEQSAWIPTDWSKIFGQQQQQPAPPAQPGVQPTAPKDNTLTSLILTGLIVIVVLGGVGGLFLYLKGKNKRGL